MGQISSDPECEETSIQYCLDNSKCYKLLGHIILMKRLFAELFLQDLKYEIIMYFLMH